MTIPDDLRLTSEVRYPFSAIVGQEMAKLALIIGAIDPTIGGVLISGPKGSGKSLLVKSFAQVLPDTSQVEGCPFHCSPDDPTNMCWKCLLIFEANKTLPVGSMPIKIVQVPLSVTEDMLVGSIDIDKVMQDGTRSLHPGLMAEANQGLLYIDEINLLPDHITDVILDAAASGWNTVEREGISVQHPSRFLLLGTMNPEEGELRPQILDRFGIYAETINIEDPDLRALVLSRNEEYASDPLTFASRYREELRGLHSRINAARGILREVEVPEEIESKVANTCSKLKVDGFRPDIVTVRAAKAIAAFHGNRIVTLEDANLSLGLALGHRTRRSGLVPPPSPIEIRKALEKATREVMKIGLSVPRIGNVVSLPAGLIKKLAKIALRNLIVTTILSIIFIVSTFYLIEIIRSSLSPQPPTPLTLLIEVTLACALYILLNHLPLRRRENLAVGVLDLSKIILQIDKGLTGGGKVGRDKGTGLGEVRYGKWYETSPEYGAKILQSVGRLTEERRDDKFGHISRAIRGGGYSHSRRGKPASSTSRGRYTSYQIPKGKPKDIALVPTLMTASVHQRKKEPPIPKIVIEPGDVRVKVREYHPSNSIVLLVDMSLSMIESMEKLAQAIYNLHGSVYRRRDRVGLVIFKGAKAFIIQHPTTNLDLIMEKLRKIGASDFTPLAAGLLEALKSLKREKLRNRDATLHLTVVSDGIVNVPLDIPLSPISRRRYVSEAQADSLDVARLIGREGFKVHVVNLNQSEEIHAVMDDGLRLRLTPTQFLIELANVSGGTYQGMNI